MVSPSVIARATASKSLLGPLDVGRLVHQGAGRIPDPIEFVMSDRYLGKASLYPRQGTMIKVLNLREDMFSQYDHDVVGEWEETFRRTGNEGISPGILDRMRINREAGRRWFREALAAIGRRGGKGHVGGLQGAYVTWHYMNVPGGPHHYYGIDPDKRLAAIVFAGKKEQAVAYQWRDLVNAITSSTCFQPFISKNQGERLTLYTPTDLLRLQQQQFEGIRVDKDQASIEIVPSGNTAMAGRGPAAFMEFFDEMAHIVKVGAGSDAKGIYDSATPALDQFGTDGFIFAGSSPWQMMGQFYDLAQLAIEMEDGQPVYPERLLIQLPSWGPYEDWKIAHTIGLAPSKKTYIDVKDSRGRIKVVEQEVVGRTYPVVRFPIQTYDEDMRKLERANPDTFAVERRSHWAASLNAYLNMTKVQAAFKPFRGEPLRMADGGPLSIYYAAHGDPAKVNDNFGFAIAHTVPPTGDEDPQFPHVVVDVVKSWRSEDFDLDEDGVRKIDYTIVQADIERMIEKFKIDHLTFDQFNSVMMIGNLNAFVRQRGFPKRIQVYERTATKGSNWREAEVFKAALNMNLIHIPTLDPDGNPSRDAELAELEMTFLEEKCYDDQTEVLTERGWMLFRDVPGGVKVATRSVGGEIEWHLPVGRIDAPYSGTLRTYRSSGLNFAVTPNHRMLVDSAAPRHRGAPRIVQARDLDLGRYSVPVVAEEDRSGRDDLIVQFGQEWPTSVVGGGRFYSADEDQLLQDHYARVPTSHLAGMMNRSERSVAVRANKMGLRKEVRWGTPPLSASVEDFAAFCGIWLADGTKTRHIGHDVELTQKKPEGIAWIDALMARLGWEHRRREVSDRGVVWRIASRDLKDYLGGLLGPEGFRLPGAAFEEWGPGSRRRLLEGLLVGDGISDSRDERDKVAFIAEHKSLADDVHRLLSVMGVAARTSLLPREAPLVDMWLVRMKTRTHATLRADRIEDVLYEGRIYCLTVPNGTLMVRREGVSMWCGNSGKVDHPSSGPVQTKDIADALMAVTYHLIGEQMGAFLNQALDEASRTMGASGQAGSFGAARPPEPVSQEDPIKRLAEITAASAPRGMDSGAARSRGMRRR